MGARDETYHEPWWWVGIVKAGWAPPLWQQLGFTGCHWWHLGSLLGNYHRKKRSVSGMKITFMDLTKELPILVQGESMVHQWCTRAIFLALLLIYGKTHSENDFLSKMRNFPSELQSLPFSLVLLLCSPPPSLVFSPTLNKAVVSLLICLRTFYYDQSKHNEGESSYCCIIIFSN